MRLKTSMLSLSQRMISFGMGAPCVKHFWKICKSRTLKGRSRLQPANLIWRRASEMWRKLQRRCLPSPRSSSGLAFGRLRYRRSKRSGNRLYQEDEIVHIDFAFSLRKSLSMFHTARRLKAPRSSLRRLASFCLLSDPSTDLSSLMTSLVLPKYTSARRLRILILQGR
jgi:hypothetical protein